MSSRTIENPGVELNEIDRSAYGKVDYSLPGSPTSLLFGFADIGEDQSFQWINSLDTLNSTYGAPCNEYEKYFYNGIYEILNRGGTCIAAKLPYWNRSYGNYSYVDFDIGSELCCDVVQRDAEDPEDTYVDGKYETLNVVYQTLIECCKILKIEGYQNIRKDLINIALAINYIVEKFAGDAPELQSTIGELVAKFKQFIDTYINSLLSLASAVDSNLTSYIDITMKKVSKHGREGYGDIGSIDELDELTTGHRRVPLGTMRIYDMTRSKYQTFDQYDGCTVTHDPEEAESEQLSSLNTNECLGIVPIVVSPMNALYFQGLLQIKGAEYKIDLSGYNNLSGFTTLYNPNVDINFDGIDQYVQMPIASINTFGDADSDGHDYESLSKQSNSFFPAITYGQDGHFDKTHLKHIGIVVAKAYKTVDATPKIGFQILESFVGSFDRNERDPVTKATLFIDTIVNTQSKYINLFSNIDMRLYDKASTLFTSAQKAMSMGFYKVDCAKKISYINSIVNPLSKLLENGSNRNTLPLDLLVDAGMSNIAQLAKISQNMTVDADKNPNIADVEWQLNDASHDTSGWRAILNKFDQFAKYQRKDILFIADGARPFCLDGNSKIVRSTAPKNTVSNSILPKLKWISGVLNSSYSAGYCNWFYQQDRATRDFFWVPPSIKVAGVCTYCDVYFHPWNAPAGMTRGVINDAVDVAFVPNDSEAGQIYSNKWNYAMSYPMNGIVIEGHKTFQLDKTALDRVNVRRLMLYLEDRTYDIARSFVYEHNTEYNRQRFVDQLSEVFDDAVENFGVREYYIKCDDELNTPQVIENNELRCKIAVKPVKVVDYIVIDMIATRQSADISEEVMR